MEQDNNNKPDDTVRLIELDLEPGNIDNSNKGFHENSIAQSAEPFNEESSYHPFTNTSSPTSYANFYTIEEIANIGTMEGGNTKQGGEDHPTIDTNKLSATEKLEPCKQDSNNSSPASPSSSISIAHVYTIEELLQLRATAKNNLSLELTKNLQNIIHKGFADQLKEAPEVDASLSLCTTPSSSTCELTLYPISELYPNLYHWKIKARVTKKMESQNWNTSKSRGKCFSVYLLDESGEIKATGYNDQCDQFYDSFQEGSVYHISSPCKIQHAKKQYSTLTNDFELFLERDTLVETAEDQEAVPQIRYEFTSISDIQFVEIDSLVDVIGILKDIPECTQTTVRKTGRPCDKRELSIYDESNETIRLTIWGNTALDFNAKLDSIVAFKRCKVGEYGGRSLSLLSSGSLKVDPDIPEAHRLRNWHTSQTRWEKPALVTPTLSAGLESSRWNDARETPQTWEVPKTREIPQTWEVPKAREILQSWEVPQTREASQTWDAPQSWEVPKTTEISQTWEVPQTTEASQTWEVPETTEASQTWEVPETREILQSWEVPKTREILQSWEVPKTREILQSWEVPKTREILQSWEVPKTTEAPQTWEVPETRETSQTWEAPRTRETPQTYEKDFSVPESTDHSSIKATIVHINQENPAYPACRSDGCYNKLSDMGDGSWYCEKCDISHSRPEYRFCLSLKVHNSTNGFFWLSCSDDVGRLLLGIDANKIIRLREYDFSVMQKYFLDADGKTFSFKVRPKKKNHQNQQRIPYEVINATPIDCVEERDKLTGIIKSFQDNLNEQFPSFPYHAF